MANDVRTPGQVMRRDTDSEGDAREQISINVDQEWQCRYWSKELCVTPAELKAAVLQVGPILNDVRAYLAKPRGGMTEPPTNTDKPR